MVVFPDPKELAKFRRGNWKPGTILWTSPEGYGWKAEETPGIWRKVVPPGTIEEEKADQEYEYEDRYDNFDRSYEKGE